MNKEKLARRVFNILRTFGAMPMYELVERLKTNDVEIREAISLLRNQGEAIVSIDRKYKIADSVEEIQAQIDTFEGRIDTYREKLRVFYNLKSELHESNVRAEKEELIKQDKKEQERKYYIGEKHTFQ